MLDWMSERSSFVLISLINFISNPPSNILVITIMEGQILISAFAQKPSEYIDQHFGCVDAPTLCSDNLQFYIKQSKLKSLLIKYAFH